jgi:hypothetical protein
MSIRHGGSGWNRCVALRPSNSSRRLRRNCAETKRKQCGLPMLPQLAHVTFWSCRLVVIGRLRVGALVHAVLATVDLDATSDAIAAVAEANGRLIDATGGEIDAAVKTVRAALKHPLMQRAARAQTLRRETLLQHCREDGTLDCGVLGKSGRSQRNHHVLTGGFGWRGAGLPSAV